jgi:PAS domain S-box-containing protein
MISVLYVDDEPALLDVSKQFLERTGEFTVDTLESAGKALEVLSEKAYDAIISDYQMPIMDGIEFLKTLRASGNTTPFIIFTGKGREQVAIEALNSGADFYIQKGGDPKSQFTELMHKIHQAVARKKAEDGLLESEERYRTLAESANDMIYITDPDGVLLYANTLCAKMFNTTPDNLVGKTQDDLFPPETAAHHKQGIRNLIARGTPGSLEEHLTTPSGEIWISVNNSPLRDKNGKITSVLGIARDITMQKQAEESLVLATRKMTIISSATRHDINNKLTIISGYTQLMRLEEPTPGIAGYITIMEKAISDISKILKFTKEYEKIGTDLPKWQDVRSVIETAVSEIELGEIGFMTEIAGIRILADAMLERVFFHLISNALVHGETTTSIRVRPEQREADLFLIVEDNGKGIPVDQKERVFARGAGKTGGRDLFLSREILSVTGLEIHETGKPGEGARFEIRVPAGKFQLG